MTCLKNDDPILEYDADREARIRADALLKKTLPERCVITFFRKGPERRALAEFPRESGAPMRLRRALIGLPIWKARVSRRSGIQSGLLSP